MAHGVHTFEGHITNHSAAAIAFHGHYWGGPMWFPRSQVELVADGGGYVLRVRDWLANKRGLLEFTEYTSEQVEAMNNI